MLPDKKAKILIYCNDFIVGAPDLEYKAPRAFPGKHIVKSCRPCECRQEGGTAIGFALLPCH